MCGRSNLACNWLNDGNIQSIKIYLRKEYLSCATAHKKKKHWICKRGQKNDFRPKEQEVSQNASQNVFLLQTKFFSEFKSTGLFLEYKCVEGSGEKSNAG